MCRVRPTGSAFVAALLLALLCLGAASCLPDAVPPKSRVNITDGTRSLPLHFFAGDWDTAIFASHVPAILAREVLGINAKVNVGQGSYIGQLYGLARCANPTSFADPQCGPQHVVQNHVSMEIWNFHDFDMVNEMLARANISEDAPENLGRIGYPGTEGIYVNERSQQLAWETEGVMLEYYKSYDQSWYNASKYFSSWDEIPASALSMCNETPQAASAGGMNSVATLGDLEGVLYDESGAVSKARCWNERWWFAPACRDQPKLCVPYIDMRGWAYIQAMQKAVFHNLPLAVSTARDWDQFIHITTNYNTLMYFSEPADASMIGVMRPKVLHFPKHNAEEWDRKIMVTAPTDYHLVKAAYARLYIHAPRVHDFVKRIQIHFSDIQGMSVTRSQNMSVAHEAIACEWVRRSRDKWQDWIPHATLCTVGMGLANADGRYAFNRSHAASCRWCDEGFYSAPFKDEVGATFVCESCAPGRSQEKPGQTHCHDCEPGHFSVASNSQSCRRCVVGTYQERQGETACVKCPAQMTTLFHGAREHSDCICREGKYRQIDGNITECLPCPGGMLCAVNSSIPPSPFPAALLNTSDLYPVSKPGFMVLAEAPLNAYKCRSAVPCPGGLPSVCGQNRDSTKIACAGCLKGFYEADNGSCQACNGNEGVVILIVSGVAGICALTCLTYVITGDIAVTPHASLTCTLLLGLLLAGIQSLSVFRNLTVQWPGPLMRVMYVVKFLSFDLNILKLDCTLGLSVVLTFLARQCIAPSGIIVIALILLAKRQHLGKSWLTYRIDLANTAGAILQLLFLPIVVSALAPHICYAHPRDHGKSLTSMTSNPSILCYVDSSHHILMAIGLLACVTIVVPFLTLVAYANWKYKAFVVAAQTNTSYALHMFRFLFYRFTPKAYYFSIIMLVRNLTVCLVPVCISNPLMQVNVMAITLLASLMTQLWLMPWRTTTANLMDCIATAGLLLLIVCAAQSTNFEPHGDIGDFGILVIGFVVFALAMLLVYNIRQRFRPGTFYSKFICHHKGGAAAQARFVQMCIMAQGHSVFIDSDNLTNLDELFDIVRTRVGQLVVYLTSNTLRRPWCAGEITVTFRTHKKVIIVEMPCFVPPMQNELQDLSTYIDMNSMSLGQYGIDADSVNAAFQWLLGPTVPKVSVPAELIGRAKFKCIVAGILGTTAADTKSSSKPKDGYKISSVIIVSDPSDDEATAAAGILRANIHQQLLSFIPGGICLLADEALSEEQVAEWIGYAHATIIMLSERSLQSPMQLCAISASMRRAASGMDVIPVSIPSFSFREESSWVYSIACARPKTVEEDQEHVRSLFKRISVYLSTDSSENVLHAQSHEILQRIPQAAGHMIRIKTDKSWGKLSGRRVVKVMSDDEDSCCHRGSPMISDDIEACVRSWSKNGPHDASPQVASDDEQSTPACRRDGRRGSWSSGCTLSALLQHKEAHSDDELSTPTVSKQRSDRSWDRGRALNTLLKSKEVYRSRSAGAQCQEVGLDDEQSTPAHRRYEKRNSWNSGCALNALLEHKKVRVTIAEPLSPDCPEPLYPASLAALSDHDVTV